MKGEIITTQFKYEVKYIEDGVKKYLHLHPDTDISDLSVGMEVEFEKVAIVNQGATYTSETGWSEDPIDEMYAKIVTEWELIEQEYMKDEYPVFGGPFTNALTPWEWLRKYYKAPEIKK